ncbi:alginate lyase [Ceratobasidium sp. AG-Ba]|nr:alginate lyase [Ceratobasidium sp. AG-Ba]
MARHKLLFLCPIAASVASTLADPNDFVDPKYVVSSRNDPVTRDARSTIIRNGDSAAKKGPWTVTDSQIRAGSNDPHDYLSWAPYHWPNCNWCGARASSANSKSPEDSDNSAADAYTADETSNERLLASSSDSSPAAGNPFMPIYARYQQSVDWSDLFSTNQGSEFGAQPFNSTEDVLGSISGSSSKKEPLLSTHERLSLESLSMELDASESFLEVTSTTPIPHYTTTIEQSRGILLAPRDSHEVFVETIAVTEVPVPTLVIPSAIQPVAPTTQPKATTSNPGGVYNRSEYPMRAHKPSKTTSCRPSPTTSMKPSETWRTCPYKPRDGRVNPDVRKLKNAAEVVDMSQAVLWNSIASVASGSDSYAKNAASFINTFFLSDRTRMNPDAEYGQVVRGPPGTQAGSYMGVLDMRGMVKVVNAVLVLRESKSQHWTPDIDAKMVAWASQYIKWVESSAAGKKAARAANNHGSFYPNQIAALKILAGDFSGAKAVLQSYFANQFQEQVVASGEQPLEAVRTRPFHYRCFNLEAIITNAKLGDYIGVNFWDSKSKYGATIQTAVNYVMSLDPRGEKIEEALPHVAAVAAVYGDPQGKYAQYLKNGNRNYPKKPFWFYDQPAAVSRGAGESRIGAMGDSPTGTTEPNAPASDVDQDHPPQLFSDGRLVELEEGLFVGWEDVRDFYRRRRLPGERRRTRIKQLVPRHVPGAGLVPPMFDDGKELELEEGTNVSWGNVEEHYETRTESS